MVRCFVRQLPEHGCRRTKQFKRRPRLIHRLQATLGWEASVVGGDQNLCGLRSSYLDQVRLIELERDGTRPCLLSIVLPCKPNDKLDGVKFEFLIQACFGPSTWNVHVGCWNVHVGCWNVHVGCWNVHVGCWDAKHISNHDCWCHVENPKTDLSVITCHVLTSVRVRVVGFKRADVAGLETNWGLNFFILDSRRILPPAPIVPRAKHISNPDCGAFLKTLNGGLLSYVCLHWPCLQP